MILEAPAESKAGFGLLWWRLFPFDKWVVTTACDFIGSATLVAPRMFHHIVDYAEAGRHYIHCRETPAGLIS